MNVLGIDPGPKGKGCGCALITHGKLLASGQAEPGDLDCVEADYLVRADAVVIEMISCYGMAVGMSTFQTLIEAGRIVQMVIQRGIPLYLVPRKDIKMIICGTSQAKDANVRSAIISRYQPTGGGSTPQIGTKAKQGPLYGVSSHAWPAVAAAMAFALALPERGIDIELFRYTEDRWMDFETVKEQK